MSKRSVMFFATHRYPVPGLNMSRLGHESLGLQHRHDATIDWLHDTITSSCQMADNDNHFHASQIIPKIHASMPTVTSKTNRPNEPRMVKT